MALNISLAENKNQQTQKNKSIRTKIKVIGIGGAGSNAVDSMIRANMEGVDFVACNTDQQTLENSLAETKIQLGAQTTQGFGTGSNPKKGAQAAKEALEEIQEILANTQLLFLTAGMGGGTGTGAIPIIAEMARDMGILTVAVVTKPFAFEGERRLKAAQTGIRKLGQYVDTLIVINNQNLFEIADESTTFNDAFHMTNEVVASGIKGITDLMTMPGIINLDFSDITTIMSERGKALIGTAEEEGEDRAIKAAERALNNQLLDDVALEQATGVLVNVTGGDDLGLLEVDRAVNMIKEAAAENAQLIFGASSSQKLQGRIRITILATGIAPMQNSEIADDDEEESELQTEENKRPSLVQPSGLAQAPHKETSQEKTGQERTPEQEVGQEQVAEPQQAEPQQAESAQPTQQQQSVQQPTQQQPQETQSVQQPTQQQQAPQQVQQQNIPQAQMQTQQAPQAQAQTQPTMQQPQMAQPQQIPQQAVATHSPYAQLNQQISEHAHNANQMAHQMAVQQTQQNVQQSNGQVGQPPNGQVVNGNGVYFNNGNPLPPIHEMMINDDPIHVPTALQNGQSHAIQGQAIQGDNINTQKHDANLKVEQLRAKIHFANHVEPQSQIDNHQAQKLAEVQAQLEDISAQVQQPANNTHAGGGMVQHIQQINGGAEPQMQEADANADANANTNDMIDEDYSDTHDDEEMGNEALADEKMNHEAIDINMDDEELDNVEFDEQEEEIRTEKPIVKLNIKRSHDEADVNLAKLPNKKKMKIRPISAMDASEENNSKPKKRQEFSNEANPESFSLPFDEVVSEEEVVAEAVNGGKMLSRKDLDIPAFLRRQAN